MGKPKKYDIRTINFGEVGHPARILIEKFIKKFGKQALSQLMRKLVVIYLSQNKDLKNWHIDKLVFERKEVVQIIKEQLDKRQKIDKQLEKSGFDLDKLVG